jgi:hypothetical protein
MKKTASSASYLRMKVTCSPETSIDFQQTTRRNIPEESAVRLNSSVIATENSTVGPYLNFCTFISFPLLHIFLSDSLLSVHCIVIFLILASFLPPIYVRRFYGNIAQITLLHENISDEFQPNLGHMLWLREFQYVEDRDFVSNVRLLRPYNC